MEIKNRYKKSVFIGKGLLNLTLAKKPEKFTIKNLYSERLEKLFSHQASNFGYQSDIEGILNELAITKEQLFKMAVNCLGRSSRTKPEIRIIASYLFLMQDFLKMLKAKSLGEKENLLLKDLLTLAEAVDLEKAQKNTVLMRFGEKGNNAFIILDGKVDVLIESYFHKNLGEKTYLYYIANLIKYHEFGLVNSIVNENFKKFPMEIIDDITIKIPGINAFKQNKNTSDYNFFNNQNDEANNYLIDNNDNNVDSSIKNSARHSVVINHIPSDIRYSLNKEFKRMKRMNTLRGTAVEEIKKSRKKKQGVFKLNYINEELKELHKIPQYSARELLDMFGLKLIDKRYNRNLNHVNTDEYIKRLNIFNNIRSDALFLKVKKDKEEKRLNKNKKFKSEKNKKKNDNDISQNEYSNTLNNNTEEMNNNSNNNNNLESVEISSSSEPSYVDIINENIIEDLKLCTYAKIISLERGSLFGEMALNEPNALRKATIIASSDSNFAVLNKKTFNNSIKMGAQRHMKETLQFFIDIPLFSGIPEGVFYNKYYTNLSKDTIVKGKNVINQGEKPDHITLLQSGSFGLTTHMSLYDLTRLIQHYTDYLINLTNKPTDISINKKDQKNKKDNKDKNNTNNKKENNQKEEKKKQENKKKLNSLNDIQKLISKENALLAESIVFKKYYFTQQFIRVNEIYCPEIIINDEYTDENGLYAFTIEAKSPENIIFTLNNKFLVDIKEKNISIQKNKEKFIKQKMDLMIKRLLIIRNSLINSFFDSKAKKEIGEAVIKELEDAIISNLKKKRVLNKKEEIIIKNNENDKKEKLTLMDLNNLVNKNKNLDLNKQYKNTDGSMQEKTFYKEDHKLKTSKLDFTKKLFKHFVKQTLEKETKGKTQTNSSMSNKKLILKPINISLKEAIKYTNHDLQKKEIHHSINNTQFNDEGPLFSLKDLKNIENSNKYSKTNYNWSQSRNTEGKIHFKPFSFSYGDNNFKNYNMALAKTPKVLMNNLIWEKMKSGLKFPIRLNLNEINNNSENNKIYNSNNINNNYHTHYGNRVFYNRNMPKINNNYINSSNNIKKASSFSNDFSFNNIKIENPNNLCFLSSKTKIKKNQKNKSFSNKKNISNNKNEQKPLKSVINLKKNEELLKMKMKKLISPDEIHMMRINKRMRYIMDGNKYNKIKEEKFQSNRKDYFKKYIVRRINQFYGKTENEKK